jgi:hypothetical protein
MDPIAEKISDNALAGFGLITLSTVLYLVIPAPYWVYVHSGVGVVAGFSFGRQLHWRRA